MILPADWDKPSEGNDLLCRKFLSGRWHGKDGFYFKYRFYMPSAGEGDRADRKYPLVVYIHGADAFGDDNDLHLSMHDIGTVFARDEWQEREPCYILAPQAKMENHWSRRDTTEYLYAFIKEFADMHEDIDACRIYVYGYSAGGLGTLNLLKRHPELAAGAIPICGASSGESIKELLKTPVWMVHAEDDRIVRATYGEPGEGSRFFLGSADIYEVLRGYNGNGADIRYTGYPEGWMKKIFGVNPHCSWVTVSDDRYGAEIRHWLFRQRKQIRS